MVETIIVLEREEVIYHELEVQQGPPGPPGPPGGGVSADPDNAIELRADGLYVSPYPQLSSSQW